MQTTIDADDTATGTVIPNETIRVLLDRSSTRVFSEQPVEQRKLDLIAECGTKAPSALGKRDPLIVISTDSGANLVLGKINRSFSTERERGLADHVSSDQPSIVDDPSIEDAFYGAPAMAYAFSPEDWEFAREDASIAADAMMVAAQSLGVGSCYISRADETFATPYGREWMRANGVPQGYRGMFALCLGYRA